MAAADETQAGVDDDSLAYAAQCIWPTAPPPDAEQVTSALSVCASQVLRTGVGLLSHDPHEQQAGVAVRGAWAYGVRFRSRARCRLYRALKGYFDYAPTAAHFPTRPTSPLLHASRFEGTGGPYTGAA